MVREVRKNTHFPKIVFTICIIITMLVSLFTNNYLNKRTIDRTNLVTELYTSRIANSLHDFVVVTETFENIMEIEDQEMSEQEFYEYAEKYYDKDTYIAIAYLPDGVVTYSYPIEENKTTIGHNVLKDANNSVDANRAIESKSTLISGPYELIQGGFGMAIRNPIFFEDEFWGFISVVVPAPKALESSGILKLENLGYQIKLVSQYKGEPTTLIQSASFEEEVAIKTEFEVYGANWLLYMYDEDENLSIALITLGVFLSGTLFSLVLFVIFNKIKDKNDKITKELEADVLTGAYNRKKLDSYLQECNPANPFTLVYIDLNDFKPVNDNYGHLVGDKLLIAYVKRLQSNLKNGGKVFRISGDEFIIILENVRQVYEADLVCQRLERISKEPFLLENKHITVSASSGYAIYPNDTSDTDEIIRIADESMYERKKEMKKGSAKEL